MIDIRPTIVGIMIGLGLLYLVYPETELIVSIFSASLAMAVSLFLKVAGFLGGTDGYRSSKHKEDES